MSLSFWFTVCPYCGSDDFRPLCRMEAWSGPLAYDEDVEVYGCDECGRDWDTVEGRAMVSSSAPGT